MTYQRLHLRLHLRLLHGARHLKSIYFFHHLGDASLSPLLPHTDCWQRVVSTSYRRDCEWSQIRNTLCSSPVASFIPAGSMSTVVWPVGWRWLHHPLPGRVSQARVRGPIWGLVKKTRMVANKSVSQRQYWWYQSFAWGHLRSYREIKHVFNELQGITNWWSEKDEQQIVTS